MSKIESGKMEIIPVTYELSTVIMDLWNVLYFRAKEKELKGNVMELPQERLDEMAALIDAFHTEEAVKQIKKWLKKPLQSGRRQLLKDVLSAIEDEFDEDQAIELLKGENEK